MRAIAAGTDLALVHAVWRPGVGRARWRGGYIKGRGGGGRVFVDLMPRRRVRVRTCNTCHHRSGASCRARLSSRVFNVDRRHLSPSLRTMRQQRPAREAASTPLCAAEVPSCALWRSASRHCRPPEVGRVTRWRDPPDAGLTAPDELRAQKLIPVWPREWASLVVGRW